MPKICYNFVFRFKIYKFYMENTRKKVLFVCSEMNPFLNTSNISDIARMVPQAIQENDNEVRIMVPRFGVINERRNRLHEVVRLSGMNISIDDNDNPLIIKVASIPGTKMQVYFLDNEDYFHRKHVFTDENDEYFADNDERTIFFCKGAIETVKKLGWYPDIIHCKGWMTSLIPLYLKTIYKDEPVFRNTRVIYSVFNNEVHGDLGTDFARKASLNSISDEELETFGVGELTNLHISAMKHADAVVRCGEALHPQVEKHLSETPEKPVLQHEEEELASKYLNFYDSVLAAGN